MSNSLASSLPIVLPLAGGALAFGALALISAAPRCGAWGDVIYCGPRNSGAPRLALTFDDGPTPDSTDRILDALATTQTPATFFVVGANAKRSPQLVRRMHDEGHLVANHSFDHSHYGWIRSTNYWENQISQTQDVIDGLIGRRTALFRPPMGVKTWCITGASRRCGHRIVTWSRRGWDGINTTPEKIRTRIGPHAHAGDVIALHDGIEPNSPRRDPSATVAAVAPLIQDLQARSLKIVRLDQLLDLPGYLS